MVAIAPDCKLRSGTFVLIDIVIRISQRRFTDSDWKGLRCLVVHDLSTRGEAIGICKSNMFKL